VISPVDQPTPWCAGMVIVPKQNGSIRVCVDLKPLNASVQWAVHPLPTVDDTLAQLQYSPFITSHTRGIFSVGLRNFFCGKTENRAWYFQRGTT